jgi:hypothetical protein
MEPVAVTASSLAGLTEARSRVDVQGQPLFWLLRAGAGTCFIGHGAFGILRKPEWMPYFEVFGIPAGLASALMPVIGLVDIAVGVAVVLSPRSVFLLYMAMWGLWTALLRPLAGESVWETLERAGNYGVPFALLLLAGIPATLGAWFARLATDPVSNQRLRQTAATLRVTTAMLLAGHGALGALTGKALLTAHYAAIGVPPSAVVAVGWAEIVLAAAVLLRPGVALLLFVCAWKLATESLFPVSGAPMWEFIERGGSYAAPLGAAVLMVWLRRQPVSSGGIP